MLGTLAAHFPAPVLGGESRWSRIQTRSRAPPPSNTLFSPPPRLACLAHLIEGSLRCESRKDWGSHRRHLIPWKSCSKCRQEWSDELPDRMQRAVLLHGPRCRYLNPPKHTRGEHCRRQTRFRRCRHEGSLHCTVDYWPCSSSSRFPRDVRTGAVARLLPSLGPSMRQHKEEKIHFILRQPSSERQEAFGALLNFLWPFQLPPTSASGGIYERCFLKSRVRE